WKVNTERLIALLEILPREHRYAFEFRELSWMTPEVCRILRRFNAAFCIYEQAKSLKAVYVYFDNDQAGYAAQNARSLRDMVLGGTRERISDAARSEE